MIVFTSYSSYRSCPSHDFGHQVVTKGGTLALTACDYVKSNQARRNSEDGSLAIENAYDHRNRRIRKVVKSYDGSSWNVTETSLFVWDGRNIVLEQITFSDSTTRTIEYYWGNDLSGTEEGAGGVGGLLATRIDGVFYVPVYGANGNVMMYVDATGAIAAQFDYDPYGRVLAAPNYWENLWNFAFSTKYHDWETDLVAYQLRTYDPVHGRWLNRDPIGERGGENLYVFCGNQPIYYASYWKLSTGAESVKGTFELVVTGAGYIASPEPDSQLPDNMTPAE